MRGRPLKLDLDLGALREDLRGEGELLPVVYVEQLRRACDDALRKAPLGGAARLVTREARPRGAERVRRRLGLALRLRERLEARDVYGAVAAVLGARQVLKLRRESRAPGSRQSHS